MTGICTISLSDFDECLADAVDSEQQGNGTWKHRVAGAAEVTIASANRFALMREKPPP